MGVEKLKTLWIQSPFGSLEQKAEAHQWLLHNIIFGFSGVWIPFLALALFGHLRTSENFLDGHPIVAAVALSAASMGFFVKETQINLRKSEMPTYVVLMVTMVLGIIVMIALAFGNQFSTTTTAQLNMPVLVCMTVLVVLLAVFLSFRLFTLGVDAVDREKVKQTLEKPITQLTEEAKQSTRVDNVNL